MLTQKRIKTAVKGLSCIREFGFIRGSWILCQLYGNKGFQIQIPGYRAPIILRSLREDVADISVFDKIFLQREYDIPVLNSKPKVIVDGGANIGCSPVFFAHKYPDAKIYAIEPEPSNYERLLLNTRAYTNIVPINAALWSKNTGVQLTNPNYGHMAFQVEEVSSEEKVGTTSSITILDLLKLTDQDHIDILKLDVECAEERLFGSSSDAWLDKVSSIVIELHDWIRPGCGMAFYRAISQYQFRQYIYGENVVVLLHGCALPRLAGM